MKAGPSRFRARPPTHDEVVLLLEEDMLLHGPMHLFEQPAMKEFDIITSCQLS